MKNQKRIALALAAGAVLASTVAPPAPSNAQSQPASKAKSFEAQIFDRTAKVIAKHLGKNAADIKASDNLIKDLGCDSLDCVELVLLIETEFGISIPDPEAEKMNTVDSVVKGVVKQINLKANPPKKDKKKSDE